MHAALMYTKNKNLLYAEYGCLKQMSVLYKMLFNVHTKT
jgi:hypothetical protein